MAAPMTTPADPVAGGPTSDPLGQGREGLGDSGQQRRTIARNATGSEESAQSWDGANTSRWWDTGHTPSGCPDCGHHWDFHTPSRGCSFCSCKNDPPNQPFVEVVTDRWANERHADCDEADCDCDCHQREEA